MKFNDKFVEMLSGTGLVQEKKWDTNDTDLHEFIRVNLCQKNTRSPLTKRHCPLNNHVVEVSQI